MDSKRDSDRPTFPLFVYVTSHVHSRTVCGAFAEGARAPQVPPSVLQPEGAVAIYGRLRGCNEILAAAIEAGRDWYYLDRGYFRATRDADYSGYFRVTKNAMQHNGRGLTDDARFKSLGIRIKPWQTKGRHILVCPPGIVFGRLAGFDSEAWMTNALAALQRHTERPVKVREKPRGMQSRNVPLADDLADCWAVVTHSSNVAVEAAIQGVPVFCTDPCAASIMGASNLSEIERPVYPDGRYEWASVLANNQWTLEEFRSGLAWRMLNA